MPGFPVFDPGIVRWAAGGAALALVLIFLMDRPQHGPNASASRSIAAPLHEAGSGSVVQAVVVYAGEQVPAIDGLRIRLARGEAAKVVGISGAVLELRGPETFEIRTDETMACGFRAEVLDEPPPQGEPAPVTPPPPASAPSRAHPASSTNRADEPVIEPPHVETPPQPKVPPAASASATASGWAVAAEAMRTGNAAGADRAFSDLSRSADPAERDAARLARAELWMTNGHVAEARPALVELAASGATPLVRKRARELLAGEK